MPSNSWITSWQKGGFLIIIALQLYSPAKLYNISITACRLGPTIRTKCTSKQHGSAHPRCVILQAQWKLQGGHKFYSLTTSKVITHSTWTLLPMPAGDIERVNTLAQGQPSLLVFWDRLSRDIGNWDPEFPPHHDDVEISGVIWDSLIIPGVDSANQNHVNASAVGIPDLNNYNTNPGGDNPNEDTGNLWYQNSPQTTSRNWAPTNCRAGTGDSPWWHIGHRPDREKFI